MRLAVELQSPIDHQRQIDNTPPMQLLKKTIPLITLVFCLGSLSCGEEEGINCTALAAAGLSVSVTDGNSTTAICDATVTAVAEDDSYTETIMNMGSGSSCQYVGLYEHSGTFTVSVEKTGYTTTDSTVTIASDECHVIQENLTVALQPN